MEPQITARPDHPVSRKQISASALKVLYALKDAGYTAYLAGGGVRDLLLGRTPKDFDVATNATPEEVRKVFRNCRLIGRRFRLAHVFFRDEIIEVSTFRAPTPPDDETLQNDNSTFLSKDGLVLRDNLFGTPEEDALRRDFTVNALFYNITDYSLIDYVNGRRDLDNRLIRVIGNPEQRFTEDPVRILRAIRFAAILGFSIEPSAREAIRQHAARLEGCSSSRLYEEIQKLISCGKAEKVFALCCELNVFEHIFPELGAWLNAPDGEGKTHWLEKSFKQIDRWRAAGIQIDPALPFALIFGEYHEWVAAQLMRDEKLPHAEALQEATHRHIRQLDRIRIPKSVTHHIAEIMTGQPRFLKTTPKNVHRMMNHRCFLDAFLYFKFAALTAGRHAAELDWWETQRKSRQRLTA
ncbi:MAG: polynucleotide adenylyltransferase PcnB [Pontiellaceae bacterium]|jgi:poly(A) polymerase|nr:polynucleotide adenylyltransferase PcnB [Pontiellaceae bacterium]